MAQSILGAAQGGAGFQREGGEGVAQGMGMNPCRHLRGQRLGCPLPHDTRQAAGGESPIYDDPHCLAPTASLAHRHEHGSVRPATAPIRSVAPGRSREFPYPHMNPLISGGSGAGPARRFVLPAERIALAASGIQCYTDLHVEGLGQACRKVVKATR
jgi:hypothetical protein